MGIHFPVPAHFSRVGKKMGATELAVAHAIQIDITIPSYRTTGSIRIGNGYTPAPLWPLILSIRSGHCFRFSGSRCHDDVTLCAWDYSLAVHSSGRNDPLAEFNLGSFNAAWH